jgi:uncharacterized protein YukE
MPQWNPNWQDINFDHHRAHEYASDCRQGARVLRSLLADQHRAAAAAAPEWRGTARTTFDEHHGHWLRTGETTALDLDAIAEQVERIAAAARAAQAQREWDRQRWLFEAAAERAIAEAA